MVLGTTRARRPAKADKLRHFTFRQFDGMWNPNDSTFNLKAEYLSVMTNVGRGSDQLLTVRYGYEEFGNGAATTPVACDFVIQPLDNKIEFFSAAEPKLVPGQKIFINFPGTFSALGIDQTIFNEPLITVSNELFVASGPGSPYWHFFCLMPKFSTTGATFSYGAPTAQMTVEPPQGIIVDMEYFLGRIVFVTDQGYIGSVGHEQTTQTIWSPAVANYVSRVIDTNAYVEFVAGQALAYVNLPNSDNALHVGDVITITQCDSDAGFCSGIPVASIVTSHQLITVDPTHLVALIRTVSPATSNGHYNCDVKYSLDRGWRGSPIVTHDIFNREIIFCNGVDKPVSYTDLREPQCQYLADPATGSNFNTPIGQFVAAGSNYTVIAGALDDRAKLHISAQGTNNTYVGDTGLDNDATNVDVAKIVANATPVITGIKFYKGLLFVGFNTSYAIYQLGEYDEDGNHIPRLVDIIDQFGTISHKSQLSVGTVFFGLDRVGVINIKQGVLQETFKPNRTSELVSSHLISTVNEISDENGQVIWSLFDRRLSRYLLFIPSGNEWLCYSYTEQADRSIKGWHLMRGYNFAAGCRDSRDQLYCSQGSIIYRLGDDTNPIHTDNGAPISFVLEFPWMDFGDRATTKTSRYMSIEAKGVGAFTVTTFVDSLYYDFEVIRSELELNPSLEYNEFSYPLLTQGSVRFTAGDTPGFGGGSQPYGGGRRVLDPRLYPWIVKFKILKIRIEGTSTAGMQFISVSPSLLQGSIRR